MFKIEVHSCDEKNGEFEGRKYSYFKLNVEVTGPDGKKRGGNMSTNKEVKPGLYSAVLLLDTDKRGNVTPVFGPLVPARA